MALGIPATSSVYRSLATNAVAVGSFDVGVLSLSSGTVIKTFSGGGRSVAITPDGKRALVTQGATVRVYDLPP